MAKDSTAIHEFPMLYATDCDFLASDVDDWIWTKAETRPGFWTIEVTFRSGPRSWWGWLTGAKETKTVRRVHLLKEEYATLDKVVSNQIYSEAKSKVYRAVVYQRSLNLWDTGSDDHVAMRTVGAWAVACYKTQSGKYEDGAGWSWWLGPIGSGVGAYFAAAAVSCPWAFGIGIGVVAATAFYRAWTHEGVHRTKLYRTPANYGYFWSGQDNRAPEGTGPAESSAPAADGGAQPEDQPKPPASSGSGKGQSSKKNRLGYQAAGEEYVNEHPGGGGTAEDSEIRASIEGRIVRRECGVGVVGQSTDDSGTARGSMKMAPGLIPGRKQICGVLSQPISKEPNVYAQEYLNALKAVDERITKKQRPYAGKASDEAKISRFVWRSMNGRRHAPFHFAKVMDLIHELTYDSIKSKKWTEGRMQNAIETLCREVDPQFKLSAAVKLESMQEEKAPRLLIADGDLGQVMALMTIHCFETLLKKHLPEKGIKGLPKKDAIKRIMKATRVPRKAAKDGVTVFEGDGSAWDTTCSASIRNLVENPVLIHIAGVVNAFIHTAPATWATAHTSVCTKPTLDLTFTKDKERQWLTIDAIRRSGHRGTSCLNWWINFTLWHCAIFEKPEFFLDPCHRNAADVTGVMRRMNSAFEGDDSFLVTAPKIIPGKELHTHVLQFWERVGFNMKIEMRTTRALFVGYYIGLDEAGPVFDEQKDEYMMVPEIDRCFARSGTSCSPAMIQAFMANDRAACIRLAGSAAMSRAFEFAGLSPTISEKFLQYAEECDFDLTHDLRMRTNESFETKSDLVAHIKILNGTCACEAAILRSTGFWCSDQELHAFIDWPWNYDNLADWQGFRDSLPVAWRQ